MLYLSSLLQTNFAYRTATKRLLKALDSHKIPYTFLENTHDIWLRDFMPIQTKSGKYVSFRYQPSYLDDAPHLKTDFGRDIRNQLNLENVVYSEINLDGGNVIFSPSKNKVIISDRVFWENDKYSSAELVQEMERLLEAQVIIIPSLRSDMTGHTDGMVRFVGENVAIGNASRSLFGLEAQIKTTLRNHGIEVFDFPYVDSKGDSAIGCYLNFLETEKAIFLPIFGIDLDDDAIKTAKSLFKKTVVPVNINEIAKDGGILNCISWGKE